MKRRLLKIPLGGDISGVTKTKYKVVLEDEISDVATLEYYRRQQQFLKVILDNPNLLVCGDRAFDKLKMFHNGERWVLEAEAEATDEPPKTSPA